MSRKQSRLFRRDGPNWVAEYYEHINGRMERRQRSTKCRDYKAAEILLRQWERDGANPNHAAQRDETMSAALDRLIATRQEQADAGRRAQSTVSFYKKKTGHLRRFFEFMVPGLDGKLIMNVGTDGRYVQVPFSLSDLEASHVDDYISLRRGEGAAENTIYKELVALRAALKLSKRRGLWAGDPSSVLPVAFAPEYVPKSRWLPVPELMKLLPQLQPDRAARVAFAVASSANLSESDRAMRPHISKDLSTVHIDGTKNNSRKREVPIVLPIGKELLAYALKHAQGEGGKLFLPWPNVQRDLIEACKRAGIEPCSTNDLRRTFSMWHQAAGALPTTLHKSMGHADDRMLNKGVYGKLEVEQRRTLLQQQMGFVVAPLQAQVACSTFAADGDGSAAKSGKSGRSQGANPSELVPRAGIEPATRGFSVPSALIPTPRKHGKTTAERRALAAHLQQTKDGATAPLVALPRKKGGAGGGK